MADYRIERRGWIGVDFDGTLAEYHGWVGWRVLGAPIPAMVERIRGWLAEEREVVIVTARVGLPIFNGVTPTHGTVRRHSCRVTGERFSDQEMALVIQKWCSDNVLSAWRPGVQCFKDVDMIELWDDRAVQVVVNTGRTLAEEHAAKMTALRGRAFGDDGPRDIDNEK